MSDAPDFEILPNDRNGPRDNAIPRFYTRAVQNNFKTQQQGTPQFDTVEFVEILIPGDRRATWDGMVKEEHKKRWPREYRYFKDGLEAPVDGLPITEWAGVTKGEAETLIFAHVKTVEQLAALSDEQLTKTLPMGGYKVRERAKRHLEQAAGNAPMEKLAAENEQQKATIVELQQQLSALSEQVAKLTNAKAD
jgi:hypothetical protein